MERKLKPINGLTEIGIIFKDILSAASFLRELAEAAEEQLRLQNEDWPTSIYWEAQEVHFYIDTYLWGPTAEPYIKEFIYCPILKYQGWADTTLPNTPINLK